MRHSTCFSGGGGTLGIPRIEPRKPDDFWLPLAIEGVGSGCSRINAGGGGACGGG